MSIPENIEDTKLNIQNEIIRIFFYAKVNKVLKDEVLKIFQNIHLGLDYNPTQKEK